MILPGVYNFSKQARKLKIKCGFFTLFAFWFCFALLCFVLFFFFHSYFLHFFFQKAKTIFRSNKFQKLIMVQVCYLRLFLYYSTSTASRRYCALYRSNKGIQAVTPPTQTQFIQRTSVIGNMKVTSNKRITAFPRTNPTPTDVPSPTGNTHSIINSNTNGMVPLNSKPLQIMDVYSSPCENGKIFEQVNVKIS